MADHLCGSDGAELSTCFNIHIFGEAIEEASGKLIAGACCVDHFVNGLSLNDEFLITGNNHRAFFTAGQGGDFDMFANR